MIIRTMKFGTWDSEHGIWNMAETFNLFGAKYAFIRKIRHQFNTPIFFFRLLFNLLSVLTLNLAAHVDNAVICKLSFPFVLKPFLLSHCMPYVHVRLELYRQRYLDTRYCIDKFKRIIVVDTESQSLNYNIFKRFTK